VDGLIHLPKPQSTRETWFYSICVHQEVAERTAQVQMIIEIYGQATMIFAWLVEGKVMPLPASERPSVIISLDAWYWANLGLLLEDVRGPFSAERDTHSREHLQRFPKVLIGNTSKVGY
jgi:hypothetical protein